jgi:hypothetical protein
MEQQESQEHDLTLLLLRLPRCHSLGCLQDDDISSSSTASSAIM